MKKHVFLGALLLSAALATGLGGCSASSSKQEETKTDTAKMEISEIRDETIEPDFTGADIEVYKCESPIDFDYSSLDTDMIFQKKDGVWEDAMDSAIPLNQEKFDAMAQNFLNLHAISEIGDAQDLDSYGLSSPVYTLTISDSEKGQISLSIGNQDENGNYYLTNEKKIYLIKASTVESLVFDYNTLVVREGLDLTVSPSDIQSVTITVNGQETSYQAADTEAMTNIAEGINNLKAYDYASYHILSQELSNAELTTDKRDTFKADLQVNGETKTLTVYLGTYADPNKEYRYVQLDGSNMIMIVENSVINNLLNGIVPDEE